MRVPVGRHIAASLDAQTPGVRTTRLLRPRTSSLGIRGVRADDTALTASSHGFGGEHILEECVEEAINLLHKP
ncbi:hypothetical protein ACVIIV_004701 [Bradyrhizobium sp. USDA 4354]